MTTSSPLDKKWKPVSASEVPVILVRYSCYRPVMSFICRYGQMDKGPSIYARP